MATDTNVRQLVLNKMTKEQYDALETKSPTELYLVTEVTILEQTTYTGTSTGDGCEFYQSSWMAIKLG